MSYHLFANLLELINVYFATKIGQGIISLDLMVIECNLSDTSKVKGFYVLKSNLSKNSPIYHVNCMLCDKINIVNKKQIPKRHTDTNFFDVSKILKTGQKSYLFASHYEHHFKSTLLCTNIFSCMNLSVFKYIMILNKHYFHRT